MLYGVILAGGRSSRMGQDKAALLFKGRSLLERARALLASAGAERIMISGRPELPDGIPDLFPHGGPPAGVYASLHRLREEGALDGSPLLLLPVDMPLLQTAALEVLLKASGTHAACHFEGEVFPCILPASEDLYLYLQSLFGAGTEPGGKRSMKGIMAFLQASALPVQDLAASNFLNANTPGEWEQICALAADPE